MNSEFIGFIAVLVGCIMLDYKILHTVGLTLILMAFLFALNDIKNKIK